MNEENVLLAVLDYGELSEESATVIAEAVGATVNPDVPAFADWPEPVDVKLTIEHDNDRVLIKIEELLTARGVKCKYDLGKELLIMTCTLCTAGKEPPYSMRPPGCELDKRSARDTLSDALGQILGSLGPPNINLN